MSEDTQSKKQAPDATSSEAEIGSLEQPATSVAPQVTKQPPKRSFNVFKKINKGFNLYLLAFIFVVLLAGVVVFIALKQDSSQTTITIDDNELNQKIIDELTANESTIGDVTQTLTVEANAIFSGKILVKDSLDVAGSINVGGPLTLPGITVSGSSTFDDVEVGNNLSILGNSSVQGSLSVQNGLNVTGNGTFTGTVSAAVISASEFKLLGDLQITRHIDTGGSTPSITSSNAVGSGGTVSISGTDTAGTITINTGNSPSTGILATVTFKKIFNGTPQIVWAPVNSAAAGLEVYVIRTSSLFTIRTNTVPAASTTYLFDFIAIE